ncbi:aminotransferase, class V family protein [Xylona heveae TC161]|uniref:phosphoserine transaminase n=1 Tax=Xylona heveae (strain CBS 132557 / TC161) TaxID=1328760 RepID=A0A165FUD1_XYLHT|nr:aminotransferase, class V family protein [Xylona heveae TC161]KZF21392.1 aminotransferase, class V family protein [Xylona heveae TC161]
MATTRSREDVHYFGAGPAPLPSVVLTEAAEALVNYKGKGLGLAEISHRSGDANDVLRETKENLTTLLNIPDNYEILFMQSGGTGEFSAVVQNLVSAWVEKRRKATDEQIRKEHPGLSDKEVESKVIASLKEQKEKELKLDYLVTGSWSLKASQEAARLIGDKYVNVALDARAHNDKKFGKIPAEDTWKLTPTGKGKPGPAFVYFCDNETVDGVEFPSFPKSLESQTGDEADGPVVVADMSSNFLSRRVDVAKYGVIFAGAQKNVGVAGITIAIVRKSLLAPAVASPPPHILRELGLAPVPIVLDYSTAAKNNSLYNTLPIFNLWIAGRVMKKLVDDYKGKGLAGQEEISHRKAEAIYGALDKYPNVYRVVPDKSVRSRMNICFRVNGGDAEREKEFLAGAEARLLQGLKGHRSVGGMRASSYNAVSEDAVHKLVAYLEHFAQAGQA